MLTTERLTLRPFVVEDLENFAALHADPNAMRDYGTTMSTEMSKARLDSILEAWQHQGYGRLAVFMGPAFVGYVGVMYRDDPDHPLGTHNEIGWRLHSRFWGFGLATEAAHAVLIQAQSTFALKDILAFTAPDNLASQAVMARLGLLRAPDLDFSISVPSFFEHWQGLVWRVPDHFGGIE
ncbi:MAG: GNAT family N-acetyltransferase [Pseudomonadota bacterium]